MSAQARARFSIALGAVLFSTGGAAIKASALSAWQIAGLRSGIAAAVLLLLVPAARRRPSLRTCVVGVCYATMMILFVHANTLTTAAGAIFLQSTAPLYVAMLAPWLLREPVTRRDLVFMVVMLIGLALLVVPAQAPSASAPKPWQGSLVGGINGVVWALTLLGLRWAARDGVGSAIQAVVAGNLLAFAVCMPVLGSPLEIAAAEWGPVLYLGCVQVGLAYGLLTRGMHRVTAFDASLLVLLEPLLSPFWAWALHDELPGLWTMAGGAVVLGAVTVRSLRSSRRPSV